MTKEDPARKGKSSAGFSNGDPVPPQSKIGGHLYLALIGLSLAVLGAVFVGILWRGYVRAAETREWSTVPAVIVISEVKERQLGVNIPTEYTHKLSYEYVVDGKSYLGERSKRRENPFYKEKAKIEAEVEKWALGSEVNSYVNPDDANESVLAHDTKAPGYSIWFPALFFVGGMGVFMKSLKSIFSKKTS